MLPWKKHVSIQKKNFKVKVEYCTNCWNCSNRFFSLLILSIGWLIELFCSKSILLRSTSGLTTYLDSGCSTTRVDEISNSSLTGRSLFFTALQFCCSSLVVKLEQLVGSSTGTHSMIFFNFCQQVLVFSLHMSRHDGGDKLNKLLKISNCSFNIKCSMILMSVKGEPESRVLTSASVGSPRSISGSGSAIRADPQHGKHHDTVKKNKSASITL